MVINPWFMGAFFGTALRVLAAGGRGVDAGRAGAAWVVLAAVVYLVGSIGVTMAFNVPRNNALAKVDPSSADGARLWADYLVTWTRWNHVRTIASLGRSGAAQRRPDPAADRRDDLTRAGD